jgi:hypothetical protein
MIARDGKMTTGENPDRLAIGLPASTGDGFSDGAKNAGTSFQPFSSANSAPAVSPVRFGRNVPAVLKLSGAKTILVAASAAFAGRGQ